MARTTQRDLLGQPIKRRRPKYEAAIEKDDRAELPFRAERVRWLEKVVPRNRRYGMPHETYMLFREAKSSFVYAHFVATIILSAAFLEHWLSASLIRLGYRKETQAGLAAMIRCAQENKLLPEVLIAKIDRLRQIRNPFVHLKDFDHHHNIVQRSLGQRRDPFAVVYEDAKEALIIMYAVATHEFRT